MHSTWEAMVNEDNYSSLRKLEVVKLFSFISSAYSIIFPSYHVIKFIVSQARQLSCSIHVFPTSRKQKIKRIQTRICKSFIFVIYLVYLFLLLLISRYPYYTTYFKSETNYSLLIKQYSNNHIWQIQDILCTKEAKSLFRKMQRIYISTYSHYSFNDAAINLSY